MSFGSGQFWVRIALNQVSSGIRLVLEQASFWIRPVLNLFGAMIGTG